MRLPKRACSQSGCRELVSDGSRCERHKRSHTARHDPIYDGAGWKEYSRAFLKANPLCCDPFDRHPGRTVAATCTGHRRAHRGDVTLFRDPSNHYPLCNSCNAFQCVKQEGGFGNVRKLGN